MVGLVNFLLDLQCISTEAQRDRTNFFRTRQKNAKEDEKTGFKPHVIQCLFGVKLSSPPGRIPLHKSIMFLIDCKIAFFPYTYSFACCFKHYYLWWISTCYLKEKRPLYLYLNDTFSLLLR